MTDQEGRDNIAANLARHCRRLGWSQQRLADEAGVTQATVSNYFNGKRDPKYFELRRIADALDVSTDRLSDPPPKTLAVAS